MTKLSQFVFELTIEIHGKLRADTSIARSFLRQDFMVKLLKYTLAMTIRRVILVGIIACCFWGLGLIAAPVASALTQIKLTNLDYQDCPAELAEGAVTAGGASMAANCFIVTGKAQNDSGKPVLNADIFGRIYDVNGNSVMQNRTRLGSIEEVPPGISSFDLRITVPANQPAPLKLEQFKAAGFAGKVRR
jgi:hypothetical protein